MWSLIIFDLNRFFFFQKIVNRSKFFSLGDHSTLKFVFVLNIIMKLLIIKLFSNCTRKILENSLLSLKRLIILKTL